MYVKVLDPNDATALVERCNAAEPSVTHNFFNTFGTSGCLLNCKDERSLDEDLWSKKTMYPAKNRQERKLVTLARKAQLNQYRGSRQDWLAAATIRASAERGCGSCNILRSTLITLFFRGAPDLPDEYEYSIAQDFEMRYRRLGEEDPIATAQLFQPPELSVRFERFRPSNFLLGRDGSIVQMRQWMNECLSGHASCAKQCAAQDDSNRPARLLDLTPIHRNGLTGIRMIETVSGLVYQYACLSHRWDHAVHEHRTTADNVSKMLDFLILEELPMNFRDAVSIARHLSIQYLWIDSLCIIQAGDDSKDLLRELAKMGSIYQNALLTIAAVSSPNSSDGCFINDRWPDTCLLVSDDANETHLIGARVLDGKGQPVSTEDVNEHYPLLTRGWVFQERLLSTRFLQCNYGELAFECLESTRCECKSIIAPHNGGTRKGKGKHKAIRSIRFTNQRHLLTQGVGENQVQILHYWQTVIQTYMELKLTVPADVLPAIAGCAQLLASSLGLTYVAGLWKELLPTDLLWHVKQRRHVKMARPDDSTAPSWSWASVAMEQTIAHIDGHRGNAWRTSDVLLRNKITEVHCKPQSATNPFGKLSSAYLKINAVLYPWYLRTICTMAKWKRPGNERYSTRGLHIKRPKSFFPCTTHIDELVFDCATVELSLDVRLGHENLVEETFSHCINDVSPHCTLAQIYLLPALHKESLPRALDVLLVLRRVAPVHGKSNCYRRIGLVKVTNDEADVRTWDGLMQERMEPRREEFWLF